MEKQHESAKQLTVLQKQIIQIERKRWRHQGTKERAIYSIGLTPIAYYQILNAMIDDPSVESKYPAIIRLLRAKRAES